MEKKKTGMESIQFWLHHTLKARLEHYGKERGLTMAESLRCLIVNLPDCGAVDAGELDRLIAKLEHRRAALRTPPPKSQEEPGEHAP
jgi:hypothetical protein